MLKIFKRNKSTIHSILIPDFGWNKEKDTKKLTQWLNPEKTVGLSINYFDVSPDLPSLKNIDTIRRYYREQVVKNNGGLIQVDFAELGGYKVIQTIFKIPQEPSGTIYLTSLTIPFNTCSYVIKIEAPEIGRTGIRDSLIADRLMKQGVINMDENGDENWSSDPYDSTFKSGTLMNKSEGTIYDAEFEDHPLTLSRKLLAQIEREIEFKPELKKLKKFEK